MKRPLIISILGAIVAGSTSMAFGQGYMVFGAAPHTIRVNPSGPPIEPEYAATFLWSTSATTAPIDAIAPTAFIDFYAGAWPDIENLSSGWQFGIDAATGTNVIALPPNNLGGFIYDGGAGFALSGSTGPGEEISVYAIAWDTQGGLYDTLAAAEAADAPVGWSSVFQYTLGSGPPAVPPQMTSVPPFGGPEPATLALVGLGGVSMILFRRTRGEKRL